MGTRRLRIAVGAVGLSFLLAVILGVTGVLVPRSSRTALGASTTISIISGDVLVRHARAADFVAVQDGDILVAGDTVRTGTDARAVLTYFEGSTVEIEPSSELVINVATANRDGSTVIQMTQSTGKTWHVVTHLLSGNSKYDVSTPTSVASVRGTAFEVDVEIKNGTPVATVTTTDGTVVHSADDPERPGQKVEIPVPAGFTSDTKKGEKPADAKPAPPPERKVTVTVDTPNNSLIVDPLGRANGIRDGKLVVQTPGAKVKIEAGKLVIELPNIPDGKIATHVDKKDDDTDVGVETKVEDKGKEAVTAHDTVKPKGGKGSTGVELGKGRDNKPSLHPLNENEKKNLPKGKVAEPPKQGDDSGSSGESGLGGDKEREKEKDRGGSSGPGGQCVPGAGGGGQGGSESQGGGERTKTPHPTEKAEPPRGGGDQSSAKPIETKGGFVPPCNFVPSVPVSAPKEPPKPEPTPKKP